MEHAGDAGGRDDPGAVVAQNLGVGQGIDGPHHLPANDRQAIADKVPQQLAVGVEQVFQAKAQLLVHKEHIAYAHAHLQNPGNQRGQGRAPHPHSREPKMPKDEHIV